MDKKIEALQKLISGHQNIVFFGGAGVSTESGIPDFRSVDGLYHQKWDYPRRRFLSHTFVRKPKEFYRFYKEKMLCEVQSQMQHIKTGTVRESREIKSSYYTEY